MAKTARIILTFDCNRRCVGCCNDSMDLMSQAKVISKVSDLAGYDEVIVTGGEPFLHPDSLVDFLKEVRALRPRPRIYLYTAMYHRGALPYVLPLVNGIHYTLHAEATHKDVDAFHAFQNYAEYFTGHSFRLYVDNRCCIPVFVKPSVWQRVEMKGWIDNGNCPLPPNETLFIWGREVDRRKLLDIVYS